MTRRSAWRRSERTSTVSSSRGAHHRSSSTWSFGRARTSGSSRAGPDSPGSGLLHVALDRGRVAYLLLVREPLIPGPLVQFVLLGGQRVDPRQHVLVFHLTPPMSSGTRGPRAER